jgi:hypothetical protein
MAQACRTDSDPPALGSGLLDRGTAFLPLRTLALATKLTWKIETYLQLHIFIIPACLSERTEDDGSETAA